MLTLFKVSQIDYQILISKLWWWSVTDGDVHLAVLYNGSIQDMKFTKDIPIKHKTTINDMNLPCGSLSIPTVNPDMMSPSKQPLTLYSGSHFRMGKNPVIIFFTSRVVHEHRDSCFFITCRREASCLTDFWYTCWKCSSLYAGLLIAIRWRSCDGCTSFSPTSIICQKWCELLK